MAYRKVIKFGDSSHVISLPKEWLAKNDIEKGHLLHIEDQGSSLHIHAQSDMKKALTETTIKYEDEFELKHFLASAYMNNYQLINIVGENVPKDLELIRSIVNEFVALEIIQQTSKKVVLKDFLNVNDISIADLMKRIDLIVLSMAEDTRQIINGHTELLEQLNQKEKDVNRLSAVLLKTLRKCEQPQMMKKLDLNYAKMIYLLDIVTFMEKAGDTLKRFSRQAVHGVHDRKIVLHWFNQMFDQYKQALDAHNKQDKRLAIKVRKRRNQLFEDCEQAFIKDPKDHVLMERTKNFNYHASNICNALIRYKED